MFKITNRWLLEHRTKNGGYTKPQLALIGVDWPPVHGWKEKVIGTPLDNESRMTFEWLAMETKIEAM